MKLLVRASVLAAALVVLSVSPAAATEPGTRHWFFWSAPLIALGTIAFIAAMAVGYYLKILRPKYRGR